MKAIDLRSDTVTQPTPAMRKAMADAEVGDDVFGEDPTVNRLQDEAARRMGMEAALFVPTGTMGNQAAVWVHSGRRGQVVCDENCHLALYEGGASALLSNVMLRTLATADGTFGPDEMLRHFTPEDPHFAPTRLVSIENTHNWSGGLCWSRAKTRAVIEAAHARNVPVHIDGARIFNAAIAERTTAARLVEGADSVMFCVSKGLSAPVGSILCGSEAFIRDAHAARKVLGGGMRQAGILAAAGLVALKTMVERLADDHANAKALAKGLAGIPRLAVDASRVKTNMVLADVTKTGMDAERFCAAMKKAGVLCLPRDSGNHVRFVTHRHISAADVKEAAGRVAKALRA
ncbi:MAG TPA: GntG family PLP-dependent aldolase [Candidatus Thermoplasmatota archaeon]|nr:GntG family PLP-dependent aldolase [Candidatus Thermoplasmatota archaeon]